MEKSGKYDPEKSRYIARRFLPGMLLMVACNIAWLFVDATKAVLVGVVSGALLAVYLFAVKSAAEKRFKVPR